MSEVPPQVRSVSRARLEPVMRKALRSPRARLRDWTWKPLLYHAVLPDRVLARVGGWALIDENAPVRWSGVLKLYQPSALTTTGKLTSPPREIRAYRSSLLDGMPGHLRALAFWVLRKAMMAASGCGWKMLATYTAVAGHWPNSASRHAIWACSTEPT